MFIDGGFLASQAPWSYSREPGDATHCWTQLGNKSTLKSFITAAISVTEKYGYSNDGG